MFKKVASRLAQSSSFRKTVMSTPVLRELAGTYIGGEDLDAGLATVQQLNAQGVKGSLNFYGMHACQAGKAEHAADEAITALRRIQAEGVDANISVKLTMIGLDIGEDYCRHQLRRILDCASESHGFVRVDMEESPYLDRTLRIFEEMRVRYGVRTVGLVIQSYLRHREADLDRLMDHGAHIRLVKGGCRERRDVAFQSELEIDDAFRHDIERLLKRGRSPAIATYDAEAIAWTRDCQHRLGLGPEALEFQMLFGVKPELLGALVADGYSVRSYIPYGGAWPTHVLSCMLQRVHPLDSARPDPPVARVS